MNYNNKREKRAKLQVNFVIEKFLGKGSFGSVFRVRRKSDDELYVAKEVDVKQLPKPERKKALDEVRLLASLQHPNIVTYHEAFADCAKLYIIMEYAKHGDLATFLNKRKQKRQPMAEYAIWLYFLQMCRGIEAMHKMGIMHRDLKPANILRCGDGIVKLADLGVAKFCRHGMAQTQIGTPYYMPPEMWQKVQKSGYTLATDMWALGCILYEMAALKVPFDGRDMKDLQRNILQKRPAALPPRCSDDIRNLSMSLLHKQAADRPTIHAVLESPAVAKQISQLGAAGQAMVAGENPDEPPNSAGSNVLATIQVPRDWRKLDLPAANYPRSRGAPSRGLSSCANSERNSVAGSVPATNMSRDPSADPSVGPSITPTLRLPAVPGAGGKIPQVPVEQKPAKVEKRFAIAKDQNRLEAKDHLRQKLDEMQNAVQGRFHAAERKALKCVHPNKANQQVPALLNRKKRGVQPLGAGGVQNEKGQFGRGGRGPRVVVHR